jgi:hypothetical protein
MLQFLYHIHINLSKSVYCYYEKGLFQNNPLCDLMPFIIPNIGQSQFLISRYIGQIHFYLVYLMINLGVPIGSCVIKLEADLVAA